jgi:hypothetical protein
MCRNCSSVQKLPRFTPFARGRLSDAPKKTNVPQPRSLRSLSTGFARYLVAYPLRVLDEQCEQPQRLRPAKAARLSLPDPVT